VREFLETPARYETLRAWLAEEFRKEEATRSADAQSIFAELGLEPGSRPRQLLESERFRLLLEEVPLADAA
jgi:hypothetical protein